MLKICEDVVKTIRTLVIYGSKYGSTRDAAEIISLVNGPAKYCTVDEFKPEYKEFEFIVLGSPIYQEKVEPSLLEFVDKNRDWLKKKPLSIFCTCLDKNGGLDQVRSLENFIDTKALSLKAIGGKLIMDKLDQEDLDLIKKFLKHVNLPFEDMDFYNPEEIINYSMKLKSLKDNLLVPLNEDKVKDFIDEFLSSHNTCTLSTGYLNRVRSTPIEYNYIDGFLYLLSEGGEKFANLLLNENVSIAVYEDYTGMNNLKGMQITGKASIVNRNNEEYNHVLNLKGLNLDVIKSLPVNMNLIKIVIKNVEFLNSDFKLEGVDAKQIIKY
jgi:menaquinone-dependent protoporphyrinogen IX oxidase